MTASKRKETVSSAAESLPSILSLDTASLSSTNAAWKSVLWGVIIPYIKKVWRDDSTTDAMGPVENGDLMRARNGARSVLADISWISTVPCSEKKYDGQ